MRHTLGLMGALVTGALAMYFLDPHLGAQRRAALRWRLASDETSAPGGLPGRRLRGRAFHHPTHADAQADAALRSLIRDRLGRMVSHPRAIDVRVEDGVVRLSGDILRLERDSLLLQVREMPGVQRLVNAMTAHDTPQGIATLDAPDEARLESRLAV